MKNIGLIGLSYDMAVIEQYQQIIDVTNPINSNIEYEILIYSIKNHSDENHLIGRLCEVYFYMMSKGVKALIFAELKLEMLSDYIDLPGKPVILNASEILTNKIEKSGIKKWLLFDLLLSQGLNFFIKNLKKDNAFFYVLNTQDRKTIKTILNQEADTSKLSSASIEILNTIIEKVSESGIQAILINSVTLYEVIQQLSVRVSIFYIPNLTAISTMNFLVDKKL